MYPYINRSVHVWRRGGSGGNSVHAYMCESVRGVYGCVCMFVRERVCAYIYINECACVRVCVSLLQERFPKQINENEKAHIETQLNRDREMIY